MDSARGYKPKNKIKIKNLKNARIGFNSNTIVIIKIPILRIISQSLFLAVVVLTLPSIGSIIRGSSTDLYKSTTGLNLIDFELLPSLFQDLKEGGLLEEGHKGLILSSAVEETEVLEFLNDKDIDLVVDSDLDTQVSIPNEMFDVIFTLSFKGNEFVDRVLKKNGIVVMQLSYINSIEFQMPSNYKIVYVRQFDFPVLALRKIWSVYGYANSPIKRWLCGFDSAIKKAAFSGLEEALLEPPLAKSSNLFKKIKFLPNLVGDSLENYNSRMFITDEGNGGLDWFYENYPMKGQNFEVYELGKMVDLGIGLRDWMVKNVGEKDYVVMKADAEVVEVMIEEKSICLVDELFLECKNKRAYWECLALYGRLRDEGVVVHQWWS
ncbi:hypothetical protein LguiB_022081 [Lonicera macranthoides]